MDNYVNINSESVDFLGLLSSYRMLLFVFLGDVGKLLNSRISSYKVKFCSSLSSPCEQQMELCLELSHTRITIRALQSLSQSVGLQYFCV